MPMSLLLLALTLQAAEPEPVTVVARAWAPFISPMGEPFRSRAPGDDTLVNWFSQADRNRDGALNAAEMQSDAERFFATLDTDRDAMIEPEELRVYEWELASEIQVNAQWQRVRGEARRREKPRRADASGYDLHGLQGAARYSLLNMPQPVAAADADLDRAVTIAEFRNAAGHRFRLLDSAADGRLMLAELQALRPVRPRKTPRPRKDARDPRIGTPVPIGN